MTHDGSHARPRKRLLARKGQVIHSDGFSLECVADTVLLVECEAAELSPWFHRPEGNERDIFLTTKAR